MTLEEFRKDIESERAKGTPDEDILGVFASMYIKGVIGRDALEAIAGELGFEMTEEAKKMSDEEFKDSIFEKSEDEVEEGKDPEDEKIDPYGDKPPVAEKSEKPDKGKEDEDDEPDPDYEDGEEEDDEDSEREEAERLFGMKFPKKK